MYTGKLIKLRAYEEKDIKQAQAFINDPEIKYYLTPSVPFPVTLEDEKKFINSQSAFKDTYSFAIETLDGVYIGGCGLNKVDWKNRSVVVGIFIGDKNYWSKGYGTDAMKVLVDFIFDEMNINRIQLNVYSFNKRAIRSYEKVGFKVEGVLRKALFKAGEYHDDIVMGLLKEEYDI